MVYESDKKYLKEKHAELQQFEAGLKSDTSEPEKVESRNISDVSESIKPDSIGSSFCIECGYRLPESSKFCPKCGKSVILEAEQQRIEDKQKPTENSSATYSGQRLQRPPEWKSESTTLLLSIILGILGLQGIGHIYVGKVGKGIAILIVSLILFVAGILTVTIGIGAVLLIIYLIMFIWQIFDSRNLCREYNDYLEKYGRKPSW